MTCPLAETCGGCSLRHLDDGAYRQAKIAAFEALVRTLPQQDIRIGEPVFVGDGVRRRGSMAFRFVKGKLTLGFNRFRSDELLDVENCPLLTPRLNGALGDIRRLMSCLCAEPVQTRRGRKIITSYLNAGDIWFCEADNGIDLVLETEAELTLAHKMILCEQASLSSEIIRISHRRTAEEMAEPLLEKSKPYLKIGGFDVYLPAGTFLQPSREGERALTGLVKKYLGTVRGRIADFFCGVGTFSYALAGDVSNKITAVDSSEALLKGFKETVNRNMIPNIEAVRKNLFKYPLDAGELAGFDAVVFDPPRAGALAQCEQLSLLPEGSKPQRLIAISCNPHSFVRDAAVLMRGGWHLDEVTMVDQFVYSNHSELVALFTKG